MASSERAEGAPTAAAEAGAATSDGPEPSPGLDSKRDGATSASRPMAATPLEQVTVSCLSNAHYHSSREAFLDTLHRWFMFLVIVLGAAALTDAIPRLYDVVFGGKVEPALIKEVCSAAAAVIAALDLTFDLSNRARAHAMMKRRYYELLATVREGRKTPAEGRVCLDEFSADEEPAYRVLHLACWNAAQKTVFGEKALKFEITFLGNLFKNWWRRPSAHYRVTGGR